jgi:DNA-binding GntR family transcriptional regulator
MAALSSLAPAQMAGENPGDEQLALADGARSLTAAVYRRLRQDIVTSRLAQNEKLHLARLQERFGVSLSVVREALSRLVADGLVVAEAQRGFRVTPISKKDLIDVTMTRVRIEGMALQMAIEKGDDAWVEAVSACLDTMNNTDRYAQTQLWSARHAEFHRLLLAPCDSAWTMRLRDLLFEQSERYRYLFVRLATDNTLTVERDVDAEHQALLHAVRARDPKAAVAALQVHFTHTMDVVLMATSIA